MKSTSGNSRKDGAEQPRSGPSGPESEAVGQKHATSAQPANGGTSALLRQSEANRTSRRQMLRRGGMVAVAAAGLTLLDQRRAEAATMNGGPFILGTVNNANATTELVPTNAGTLATPLFRVDGTTLSSTSTTVIIDAPPGPNGVGLVINAPGGALGVAVNGGAGAFGVSAGASSTATTVGLAVSGNGSGTAGGVSGSSGSGAGVAGESNTGVAVQGTITNTSSGAYAVYGTTAGSGAAIRGYGSGTGARGGDFTGNVAGIRIRPASGPHPASGKIGDFFVDSKNDLFFCKGGTTWVKLA